MGFFNLSFAKCLWLPGNFRFPGLQLITAWCPRGYRL